MVADLSVDSQLVGVWMDSALAGGKTTDTHEDWALTATTSKTNRCLVGVTACC